MNRRFSRKPVERSAFQANDRSRLLSHIDRVDYQQPVDSGEIWQ